MQNALANPIGVCVDGPPALRILPVGSIENPVDAGGTTFQVDIVDRDDLPAAINSATLVFDPGTGDQSVAMADMGSGRYEATLSSLTCGQGVTFRIDVEATNGSTIRHPFSADNSIDRRYRRHVGNGLDTTFYDDFEIGSRLDRLRLTFHSPLEPGNVELQPAMDSEKIHLGMPTVRVAASSPPTREATPISTVA